MEHILQKTIIKSTCFIYCGLSFTFTWQKFKNFRLETFVWKIAHLFGNLCMGKHFLPTENLFLDPETNSWLTGFNKWLQPTQPLINFSLFFLMLYTFEFKNMKWSYTDHRNITYIIYYEEISLQIVTYVASKRNNFWKNTMPQVQKSWITQTEKHTQFKMDWKSISWNYNRNS